MKARDSSFALLRLLRRNNTDAFKILYRAANKNFKDLCLIKKKASYQQNITLINRSRSSAEFWKAVKLINGKKNSIAPGLQAEQFKVHFMNLLSIPQNSLSFQYAAPLYFDEFLDAPFSSEEVQVAIDKSKKNKTPGEDRISFEFYKNCTPE